MSLSTAPYSQGRAWLTAIVGLVTAIVLSFIYASISCSMDLLMENFDIGPAAAGWLITGCYLVSVVLALPGGVLIDKFGPLWVGLVGIAISIVGTILGCFATDYVFLMVTRVIQGVGPALVAIAVPTVISAWFSSAKRGPAMTLFSLWQSIGIFIVFAAAAYLLIPDDVTSWHNMWYLTLAGEVVVGILYALVIRMPSERQDLDEVEAEDSSETKGSMLEGFKSVATWALALAFACWAVLADTFINFTPLYCIEVLGLDSAVANADASLISIGMIVGGLVMTPILGLVKKFSQRMIFLLVGEVVLTCISFMMFGYDEAMAIPYMVATGTIMMIIPAICFTVSPDTALKPIYLGVTMGIFALAQNLGLGAAIAGTFLESFGWGNMAIFTTIVGAILIISSSIVFVTMKQRAAKAAAQPSASDI